MTTATIDTVPALPRFGMLRVTWLQHRVALTWVVAVLAAAGAVLLVSGFVLRDTFHSLGLDQCTTVVSGSCQDLANAFVQQTSAWTNLMPVLLVLPVSIGGFLGAPLLAREFETGTFRFAWTQGLRPGHWITTKLLALGLTLTTLTLLLSWLADWSRAPLDEIRGLWATLNFDVIGPVFGAHALFAFCLGALAGTLLRRTVAAIAATSAGCAALMFPTAMLLRRDYLPPLHVTVDNANESDIMHGWLLQQGFQHSDGRPLDNTELRELYSQLILQGRKGAQWLAQHGYQEWITYQPAGRYWPFQWIEAGGITAFALVLAVVTVWLIHRRAA